MNENENETKKGLNTTLELVYISDSRYDSLRLFTSPGVTDVSLIVFFLCQNLQIRTIPIPINPRSCQFYLFHTSTLSPLAIEIKFCICTQIHIFKSTTNDAENGVFFYVFGVKYSIKRGVCIGLP